MKDDFRSDHVGPSGPPPNVGSAVKPPESPVRVHLVSEPDITDHVSPTGGLRRNAGKLAVHLVPPVLIRAVAAVLGIGARKYAARNWELGMEYSVAYASLQRHALAFWSGEDVDPESGEHHMAHVATNAAFLLEYARRIENLTLPASLDDRPDGGAQAADDNAAEAQALDDALSAGDLRAARAAMRASR